MKSTNVVLTFMLTTFGAFSQDKSLPYYEIPATPANYTAAAVAARFIDGLGFRYYWATEGLRPEDLNFKPSKEARTSQETITHIYGLSRIIVNSTRKVPTVFGADELTLPFIDMRKKTLENFRAASDLLKKSRDSDLKDFDMVFKRDTTQNTFPFWNELNGPIADAVWHVGQVVSFRRSSGNPFNSNASVLTGKVKIAPGGED